MRNSYFVVAHNGFGRTFSSYSRGRCRNKLASIHHSPSFNEEGLFRDFFYIVVVVALIAICAIINTFAQKDRPHSLVVLCYVMAIGWMMYVLIYGTGEFSYLATKGTEKFVVSEARFRYDFSVIVSTCVVGVLVELLLAFRGE